MGFFANFKAKRAAKRANAVYQTELLEWERENQVLTQALDIFTAASSGTQPDDQSLVQKKGELVLWTGNAVYSVAGRTPSTFSGGSQGFSIPLVAGIRYRIPATIQAIQNELKEGATDKPMLELPPSVWGLIQNIRD